MLNGGERSSMGDVKGREGWRGTHPITGALYTRAGVSRASRDYGTMRSYAHLKRTKQREPTNRRG